MDKEVLNYVVDKSHELIASPTCSKEAADAARAWLDAVGTDRQAEETKKYIAELEADIVPIDGLIQLAESETGIKIFGEEKAKEVACHGKEIKAAGAKFCDCPACSIVSEILSKKGQLLES